MFKVCVEVDVFVSGHPVFPVLFVEEMILSSLNDLCIFVKNNLTVFVFVYFWTLCSVTFIDLSFFLTPQHLGPCGFRVSLEMG